MEEGTEATKMSLSEFLLGLLAFALVIGAGYGLYWVANHRPHPGCFIHEKL